jgi:cbb3-type cytochrome oxidase maturation protein
MSVILILILASLGLAVAFLAAFVWAVRAGQYDDTCTPSMRVLLDREHGGPGTSASALINSPLQPGEPASLDRSNRFSGFHRIPDALTTREAAEAVPRRAAAQATPLKPGVNESDEFKTLNLEPRILHHDFS